MNKDLIVSKLKELFGADYRSLVTFRVGLAMIALCDLYYRALYLRVHYTDFGLLPRSVVITEFPPWHFSLHMLSPIAGPQIFLFAVAGIASLCLLVGYRTRLALFLVWLHVISLHGRNPLIIQGGDVLFRVILFWGLFLPLGARGSIDALRSRSDQKEKSVLSIGTLAVGIQFVMLYVYNYLYKLHPPWETEGTAIYQALSLDQFATSFAIWLREFPEFLSLITKPILLFEGFGAILLFIPFFTGPIRTLGCFLFIAMHFSFWLCLEVGPFPYVNVVFAAFFLPTFFWDRIEPYISKTTNLFSRLVLWLNNRLSGNKLFPEAEEPNTFWKKSFINLAAFVFLFNAVYFTVGTYKDKVNLPVWVDYISSFVRIDQRWNMFAPPSLDDGWYVIPAKLRNGEKFDLHKHFWSDEDRPAVSWEKPKRVSKTYPTQRWRKYLMNLWHPDGRKFLLHYGRYLCRDWNEVHRGPDALETFQIYFMLEMTSLETQTPPLEKVHLWTHWCFEVPENQK